MNELGAHGQSARSIIPLSEARDAPSQRVSPPRAQRQEDISPLKDVFSIGIYVFEKRAGIKSGCKKDALELDGMDYIFLYCPMEPGCLLLGKPVEAVSRWCFLLNSTARTWGSAGCDKKHSSVVNYYADTIHDTHFIVHYNS
ncbi:hypothetical protein NDU88_003209 [Pleurodeles waltl]|uniref:Uncharacterized protein n=1 Tax=Pleurodeles waltl TaxID=8319 RepID=A0AAV7TNF7_PLEWA|nr:hypothetical protein NDU88_003209 [Pleurodeles waltl]